MMNTSPGLIVVGGKSARMDRTAQRKGAKWPIMLVSESTISLPRASNSPPLTSAPPLIVVE